MNKKLKSSTKKPQEFIKQFKITIEIENEMFVIGISDPHLNVAWLASEAASRYFLETGEKISLTIKNNEGAELLPEELLGIILANGDKLTASTIIKKDNNNKVDNNGCCTTTEVSSIMDECCSIHECCLTKEDCCIIL